MKLRRGMLVLFALLCGPTLFMGWSWREPRFEGKALGGWLRGLEYENVNPTDDQRRALRAMGERGIDALIRRLGHRDSLLKREFVAYAESHPNVHNRFIARRYVVPENLIHSQAATALGEIGPRAERAIPALEAASSSPDMILATRAKAALLKVRGDDLSALLKDLEDLRSATWTRSARTAKFLGTNAEAAVPLMTKALQDTNFIVRAGAANALAGIASRPEIALPALIECAKHEPSAEVRRNAIDALCQFKGEKQTVAPVLLGFVRDQDLNVWLGAAFGLEDMLTPEEKKAQLVPALKQALGNPNETIRENAELFLKRLSPEQ